MESFVTPMKERAYSRRQQESREPRERRIALFMERVKECEVDFEQVRAGARTSLAQDHQPWSRKPPTQKVDLGSLSPISVAELSVGKVHKGRVLYCRTATRCMFLQSLAALVEDSDGQLSSLAVYNAPGVRTIWDAQAWLPEGTSLAIVEPFFKLRQDGTPGIRVDDPKAVGAKDSEAERWQRELCAKEEQMAFEQDSLAAQAAQLAEMQAELAEKRRLLEEKDRQLQQEKQAKEQLLAGGSLSKELLGAQRSGHHCVSLHEVKFSQDSIAASFRDGRSIGQTTRDLRQGKLKPADLPTLRVVELPGLKQIWSLDNRRLRCLKDAFPQGKLKIDVQVMPLSDPAVQAEFRKKWTAGESIHIRSVTGRRQHAA